MGEPFIFRIPTVGEVGDRFFALKRKNIAEKNRTILKFEYCRESEYAAWTLVNGYTLNHVTVSVHRLKSHLQTIKNLNQFIEENGFRLNSEGGILKGNIFLKTV